MNPHLQRFHEIEKAGNWKRAFHDEGTGSGWEQKWFLDGETSRVRCSPLGMVLTSGPNRKENGDSMVLWTQDAYRGDVKIEYDYTRIDQETSRVNILYLQATGIGRGPYANDIRVWSGLRKKPQMKLYYQNMNLLHISYAVDRFDQDTEYLRARQYPVPEGGNFEQDTEIKDTYFKTGLFKPGVTYHVTVIKRSSTMYFHVADDGQNQLFQWHLNAFPPLVEGRIGFRQMQARESRYCNIHISTWQDEEIQSR